MSIELVLYIFFSVLIVSLISFIGVLSFLFNKNNLQTVILFLVSFSAGALLGDAFLHLIPEAFEQNGINVYSSIYILVGIIMFFSLEKFIHWKHCHTNMMYVLVLQNKRKLVH